MIDTPNKNVSLTLEQLQQIAEVETTLSGLNEQISIKDKKLRIIQKDTERALVENENKTKISEDLDTLITSKLVKSSKLDEEVTEKVAKLNNLLDLIREHTTLYENKLSELKDKTSALEKSIKEHTASVETHGKAVAEHQVRSETFNSKVARLKEVIKDF